MAATLYKDMGGDAALIGMGVDILARLKRPTCAVTAKEIGDAYVEAAAAHGVREDDDENTSQIKLAGLFWVLDLFAKVRGASLMRLLKRDFSKDAPAFNALRVRFNRWNL